MFACSKLFKPYNRLIRQGYLLDQTCSLSKLTSNPNVNTFTERTHNCGQITEADIGKRVRLYGWVKHTRFDNKIISLRDSYGSIQCIVDKNLLTKTFRKAAIHNESVLEISGLVRERFDQQKDKQVSTGLMEVLADEVILKSAANKDLPILTRDVDVETRQVNRLQYRYLDIRSKHLQEALRFRSKVSQIFRSKLHDLGFVECETPTLFRRTPGGANEFIVPTQTPDMFYGLTQSPQQLKQLLMIGAIDRYFQICRCYRDESGRSDRQPEFTQLDIELSFTNQNLVMNLIEQLLYDLFVRLNDETDLSVNPTAIFGSSKQLQRLSYQEAFLNYGTDKPDTRFGWRILDNESDGLCIEMPHSINQVKLKEIIDSVASDKSNMVSSEVYDKRTKISINSGLSDKLSREILGSVRVKVAAYLERELKVKVYSKPYKFLWVTDFPLFTERESTGELVSNHHPFTAPTEDTEHLLKSDPLKVLGQHYDLVLNGQEVGGGSMRIHDANLQKLIFSDILKLEESTFRYFIQALSSGCPPHGGIALGLDRLLAILLDRFSIRDVIAFPKSTAGRDLMSESPHEIADETKRMYHIASRKVD